MTNDKVLHQIYNLADSYNVLMKGHIVISRDTHVILFAHYCKSTLFYKDFFRITRDTFKVNNGANKLLKASKRILKEAGYQQVWTKGIFSLYGDLRPLAVEAQFGKWGKEGIIVNEKYGTDFLITAIFYR